MVEPIFGVESVFAVKSAYKSAVDDPLKTVGRPIDSVCVPIVGVEADGFGDVVKGRAGN